MSAPSSLSRLGSEPLRRAQLRSRMLNPWRRRTFHQFGRHAILDRPQWVYGSHWMSIGDRAVIMRGAWLSVELSARKSPEPALVIGEGVWIRPGATISASERVVIEDYVVMAGSCSLVDSDHTHGPSGNHTRGERECILHNPSVSAPIRIGRGTWLGQGVTVLRGADIGAHCTIGAHSVVRGTIPDYSIAVGAPARVVGSTRE